MGQIFENLRDGLWSVPERILVFLLTFALLGIGLRVSNWLIRRAVERRRYLLRSWDYAGSDRHRTESITRVLQTAVRALVAVLAVLLILATLGINTGAILASVSLVSVAVGFGAQYLVRDYLSGILILTEDQFRVGDSVELNKISGTVEDMRLRLTVLRGEDGTLHLIPNGEIRIASNRSREFTQISLLVTLDHDADLTAAFATIDRIGAEIAADPIWTGAIIDPLTAARVEQLTGKGPVIRVIGTTAPGSGERVQSEFRVRLMGALDGEQIEIS